MGYTMYLDYNPELEKNYPNEPHPIKILVREALEHPKKQAEIPAIKMLIRLKKTIDILLEAQQTKPELTNAKIAELLQKYVGFVQKAAEKETEYGEPVTVAIVKK